MSWSSPRTYAVGEIVSAAILNTDQKANLEALSTHNHSGTGGAGNDEMNGVDSVTYDHISDPSAPGSGKLILYAKSGGVFFRDGATGDVTQLSDENHTH